MNSAADRPHERRAALRLLAAVLLLITAGVSLDSLAPALRLAGSILLALVLGGWWTLAAPRPARLPTILVLASVLGLVILQLLSLIWTPFPGPAYLTLVKSVLLIAILIVVMNASPNAAARKTWQDAVIIAALALVVIEMILFITWWNRWRAVAPGGSLLPPVGYRSSGLLLGHPNVLAGLINLAVPFLIVRWQSDGRSRARWIALLPVGILLAGLFLTSSRAGWLSGGAGITVTLGVLLMATRNGIRAGRRLCTSRLKPWHAALALALLAAAGATAYWQASRTGHQPLGQSRTPVWSATIDIIAESPIIGGGLQSYPVRYAALPNDHREEDIPHAHNLALQVTAETGLVGLLLLLLGLAGLARAAWQAWSTSDPSGRIKLAAYAGAGAAAITHSLVDYLLGPPLYSAAVVMLVGSFAGARDLTPGLEWRANRVKRGSVALVWILAAFAIAIPLRSSWAAWDGALASRDREWKMSAEVYCPGLETDPNDPVLASGCGLSRSLVGRRPLTPRVSAEILTALQQAAEVDPAWGIHFGNLGAGMIDAGRYQQAAAALEQGLQVYPVSADLLLTRGLAAERMADLERANSYYRKALETDPWIWFSAFMQSNPERRRSVDPTDIYPEGEAERAAWEAALHMHGSDFVRARAALNRALELNPANLRALALEAELALVEGDAAQALARSQVALFAAPDHPIALEIRAYILHSLGDQAADRAILAAVESLAYRSQSLRYFSAAYGQLGPVPDRAPGFVRSAISNRMAIIASTLLGSADGQELSPRDLETIRTLFAYCGCEPRAGVQTQGTR